MRRFGAFEGFMSARRTALVTGASSGIGAALARTFAGLGWSVAVGARRSDRLQETAAAIEAAGGKPFAARLDVTEPESIDSFFRDAEKALGAIDVVVSNAGIGTPGLAHELSVGGFEARQELDAVVSPEPDVDQSGVCREGGQGRERGRGGVHGADFEAFGFEELDQALCQVLIVFDEE